MQTKLCVCFCGPDSHVMFHIFTYRYTCFILVLSLYCSLGHIYITLSTCDYKHVATCKEAGNECLTPY